MSDSPPQNNWAVLMNPPNQKCPLICFNKIDGMDIWYIFAFKRFPVRYQQNPIRFETESEEPSWLNHPPQPGARPQHETLGGICDCRGAPWKARCASESRRLLVRRSWKNGHANLAFDEIWWTFLGQKPVFVVGWCKIWNLAPGTVWIQYSNFMKHI